MVVRNKTDEVHWTDSVSNWGIYEGDVVVSPDPQERLGGAYLVSEVRDEAERIRQRGLFWTEEDAIEFAESIDESE